MSLHLQEKSIIVSESTQTVKKMPTTPKKRSVKQYLLVVHRFYQMTGGYTFIGRAFWKLGLGVVAAVVVLYFLNKYVFDVTETVGMITRVLPWWAVITTLFLSEIVTGILPPDLYILWARSLPAPWLMVSLLAALSYLGGVVSYWVGVRLHELPKVKEWVDVKFAEQFIQIKRFGGLLIFLAAMTPLPFSPTSTVAGVVRFPFRMYLIVALSRFLRFWLYAAFLYGAL